MYQSYRTQTRANKKRLSLPPRSKPDSESDDEYEQKPLLRLKGGAGSSSGSPSGTPTTKDRRRKQSEGNDFSDHELVEDKKLQRTKTSNRICATMDANPNSLLVGRLLEARSSKPTVGTKQQQAKTKTTDLATELAIKPKLPAMSNVHVAGGPKPRN
ncbi:Hypothetical protein CINCED_3A006476 [Cinara cedri]|uniref:Uncharacterized protein n=1 Tax=Cinara cedri TaxID=506608 RepID=A0A5E4MZD6_9HEMI|nr:Hypothetical protein CINCED_3A006476 [Cinara cedri]